MWKDQHHSGCVCGGMGHLTRHHDEVVKLGSGSSGALRARPLRPVLLRHVRRPLQRVAPRASRMAGARVDVVRAEVGRVRTPRGSRPRLKRAAGPPRPCSAPTAARRASDPRVSFGRAPHLARAPTRQAAHRGAPLHPRHAHRLLEKRVRADDATLCPRAEVRRLARRPAGPAATQPGRRVECAGRRRDRAIQGPLEAEHWLGERPERRAEGWQSGPAGVGCERRGRL